MIMNNKTQFSFSPKMVGILTTLVILIVLIVWTYVYSSDVFDKLLDIVFVISLISFLFEGLSFFFNFRVIPLPVSKRLSSWIFFTSLMIQIFFYLN